MASVLLSIRITPYHAQTFEEQIEPKISSSRAAAIATKFILANGYSTAGLKVKSGHSTGGSYRLSVQVHDPTQKLTFRVWVDGIAGRVCTFVEDDYHRWQDEWKAGTAHHYLITSVQNALPRLQQMRKSCGVPDKWLVNAPQFVQGSEFVEPRFIAKFTEEPHGYPFLSYGNEATIVGDPRTGGLTYFKIDWHCKVKRWKLTVKAEAAKKTAEKWARSTGRMAPVVPTQPFLGYAVPQVINSSLISYENAAVLAYRFSVPNNPKKYRTTEGTKFFYYPDEWIFIDAGDGHLIGAQQSPPDLGPNK